TTSEFDGEWKIASDSVVGYRVKEILFGQSSEGVGRTSAITGSLTIAGRQVSAGRFVVDMTTLKSDSSRRDRQVNTRILSTSTYPTAKFVLTTPIDLTPESFTGTDLAVETVGTLTLHGVTKDVSVSLVARLVDDVIEVSGNIQIVFADWSIPDPSIAAIVVEDRGLLEFLLRFTR
ncbi:MAG: YceI family protein, partial [Actinobacteria bacterium]|nr:YceI family protein [Actinomycetota bacterium]